MGCAITSLLNPSPITLQDLRGKTLAVDAYNQLYMFLATIRGPDGTLLTNSKGDVTSHLSGVFSRFTRLMEQDMRFVFVFDGMAPTLKKEERERRQQIKQKARADFAVAKATGDVDSMRKYAARTTQLTPNMLKEVRRLIQALGIPILDAPTEGEAQAASLVQRGDAYAVLSQDADALLFGAPKVVRNLSISGRRQMTGRSTTLPVEPLLIRLDSTLFTLKLTQRQLIALALLVGTDYNVGGIKGLGPKKSLALVQQHGEDLEGLFSQVDWNAHFSFSWKEPFALFETMPVLEEYSLKFLPIDRAEVLQVMVEDHQFSRERIDGTLNRLAALPARTQRALGDFF